MSFCIDDVKILGKYKAILTTLKDFKNIKLNPLSVYDRYTKTKIRTCSIEVYTNFCGLNVPEYYIECESFTAISTDSLLVYENKYYLQVYSDNCTY